MQNLHAGADKMKILKVWCAQSRIYGNMNKNHVSAYSAQAAYFIILSFIPFMLLLMTSVRYTPLNRQEVINAVMQICPESFETFIQGIVNEVYEKSLTVVPLSGVIALWSAGKGIQSLTNGFNCIYQVKETRNYIVTRIRSVFYTLVFVIAIILTLILQVFGNSLQRELSKHLPFLDKLVSMIISIASDHHPAGPVCGVPFSV